MAAYDGKIDRYARLKRPVFVKANLCARPAAYITTLYTLSGEKARSPPAQSSITRGK